jgi:hypothetical protein
VFADCLADDRLEDDALRPGLAAFVAFAGVLREVFRTVARRAGAVFFFAAALRVVAALPRAVLFFVVFFAKLTSGTPPCTASAR